MSLLKIQMSLHSLIFTDPMLPCTLNQCSSSLFCMQIVHAPEEWPSWVQEVCSHNSWSHPSSPPSSPSRPSSSPLVWRELLDRGGKGLYLGGLSEFEQYARHYYDVVVETDTLSEQKIAAENLDSLKALELERQTSPKVEPLRLCITNATSETAYHLASQIVRGGVGGEQALALQLLDSADNLPQLEGIAMELTDLAAPHLVRVQVTSSVQEALNSVSIAFILDYPHQVLEQRQGEPAPSNEEPALSKEEPASSKEEPTSSASSNEEHQVFGQRKEEPAPSNEEPASSNEEPALSNEEHQVFGQRKEEPPSSNEEPASSNEEPALSKEEPASSKEEPTPSKEEPASSKEEPAPSNEEPTPSNEEPASSKEEPAPSKEEPAPSKEEPAPSNEEHQVSEQRQGESASSNQEKNGELASSALRYHQYATTLDFCAQKDIKVILSGKYANTGAAIMAKAITSIPRTSFVACPSLVEAQARSILAQRLDVNTADVRQVAIWGRTHGTVLSDTSYTRVHRFKGAVVGPESFSLPVSRCIFEKEWLSKEFPVLLAARHGGMEGYRSNRCPLSEAIGLVTLARDWCSGRGGEEWWSMGVVCEGSEGVYGIPEGLVFSVPVRLCEDGEGGRVWRVEKGLDIDQEMQVRWFIN